MGCRTSRSPRKSTRYSTNSTREPPSSSTTRHRQLHDPAHGPACGACLTVGASPGSAARGVSEPAAAGAQRAPPRLRCGALRAGRVNGSCGLLARRDPRRKACGERGCRRLGNLPMRTVSRQGAAHQDEVANSCISNICHTAPGDERPRLAETFCGKVSLVMLDSVQALPHLTFFPCMEPLLVFWYDRQQERRPVE